jgi:hypothetical protein
MNYQLTGLKFFTDFYDIDETNVFAAFSFYSGFNNDNIVYPENNFSNSASGILNNSNTFFSNYGSGYFNGNTNFILNKNYDFEDSIVFISYEKLSFGDQILLSSVTGNSFNTYAGFCVGINDANKLYFRYWNPVEGPFTFTYSKVLADKNLIILSRSESNFTIGSYNNNTFSFEFENFNIFNNSFKNSNFLMVGSKSVNVPWLENSKNFVGYIDKFYIINDLNAFSYRDEIVSGLYAVPTGIINQTFIEECYETGTFIESGYSYIEITGTTISGFLSGTNQLSGYVLSGSGYSYLDVTGFERILIGFYTDLCGETFELYEDIPVSGLVNKIIDVNVPVFQDIFVTGYVEVELSGIVSGNILVPITGLECVKVPNDDGVTVFYIDSNYLSSLYYKEISLLSKINNQTDIVEIFTEKYALETLFYNRDLFYDDLNKNYFYIDKEYSQNEILLFGNGQALIDSGYQLIPNGYETIRSPNLDYFITGITVETNKFFGNEDYLFYDYFSGNFWAFENTGNGINIPNNINNYWLFKNGQKLIENKDYTVATLSGSNYSLQFILNDSSIVSSAWGRQISSNVDSSILVVTSQTDFQNGFQDGAAYIYTKNSENKFVFKQKITGRNGSLLGTSVDITDDGSIILLGASNAVFIYTGNGQNGWQFKQEVTGGGQNFVEDGAGAGGPGDLFGRRVSINKNGSIFIVGASSDSQNGADAGASFIYTGNGQNGWQFKQKLTGRLLGAFGSSVHINDSGNVLMMAGPTDRFGPVFRAGAVFVYTGNSQNGWTFKQSLNGLNADSRFGWDIDANNDSSVLLISCQNSNPSLVYTGNAINGWSLKGPLSYPSNADTFGSRVAVNKDGSVLFLSSIREDIPNGIDAGASFVYTGNAQNGWNLKQSLFVEDSNDDFFGQDLTMNGDGSILMMSSTNYIGNDNKGAVAIYTLDKQIQLIDNNQNYYIIKEIPNNFTYTSGNLGSLKLPRNFNHNCSQVYYNGIKQKINNNYIENAIFDLISGNKHEFDFSLDLIYNNTDDFFV